MDRLERLTKEKKALKKDLGSLRRHNQELERELKNRGVLLEEFPAGMVLVQGERIIDLNRRVAHETGYAKDEIIGRSFLELFHPRVRDQIRKYHRRRIAGKWAPELYQTEILSRTGKVLWCEVEVKRIRFNGKVAFLKRLDRIDERRKRERELIMSEKMGALTRMAAGLSRQLVQGLKGIEESAGHVKAVVGTREKSLVGPMRNMEYAIGRLNETARDLEAMAKGEIEDHDVGFIDLNKLVKDAVSLAEHRVRAIEEERTVELNIKSYFRSVSGVRGSPKEIRDAVANIIINAAEAMPRGGDIFVTTEENEGSAIIYVQDSGLGIPRECLDRVFEPCFSLKAEGRRGMGLSLAYAVARKHGGALEITSREGQGTRVLMKLPLAPEVQDRGERKRRPRITGSNILVMVEDDMLRELLLEVLAGKGFGVAAADGYGDTLNKVKKNRYDMVILDTQGYNAHMMKTFTEKIGEMDRAISMLLINGHREEGRQIEEKHPLGDLVIKRPIDMDWLVRKVSDMLIQKRRSG
ncbi:MAG: PAS domain S-box protein [Deltaproteobacteria bacterium]|nr:PAS domain S-box protein [Deltaproteobacteria bacterium]